MTERSSMTRQQVRRVDQWAIETVGIAGVVLMENAGRNATDAICRRLQSAEAPQVAVLAGAGNNGGDGFVVARHLRLRGVTVDVYLLAAREKVRGDAKVNLDILERVGPAVEECQGHQAAEMSRRWGGYDLLVDALGGTGIVGELRGNLAAAVSAANAAGPAIVALDIPTGLNCDTGQPQGSTIRAVETITFAAAKVGFAQEGAREYTGDVLVADIGVAVENMPPDDGEV